MQSRPTPPTLDFEGVSKTYQSLWRRVDALRELHLSLRPGEIVGLVGPNGAGKSTLMELALGYLRPSSGRVQAFGRPAGEPETRRRIGWMPDNPLFPRGASARRLLERSLGDRGLEIHPRCGQLLEHVGLDGDADRPVLGFSRGMKQRCLLALALGHEPELLLLDEPTLGMDPLGVRLVREALLAHRDEGGSALVSSHQLSELTLTCDRVLFVSKGRVETEVELRGEERRASVCLRVDDAARAHELLGSDSAPAVGRSGHEGDSLTVMLAGEDEVPELVSYLAATGVRIHEITRESVDLERVFLEIEGGAA
jgi:ABC-2 type transport system ATP-binding protein